MRTIGIGAMIMVTAAAAVAQTPVFRSAGRTSLPGSATDTFYLGTLIVADISSPDGPPDGFLDLITANSSGNAPVKWGDGHGGFTNCCSTQVGTIPSAMALADFDGDAVPDLLVGDSRFVRFLKGNTGIDSGTFQDPVAMIPAGHGVSAILTTDLNGDHKVDALVINDADQTAGANGALMVLMGNGNGTFVTPGPTFATGVGSESAVLGDFNRDGKTDVAVANAGSGDITILLGDSAAGFTFGQVPKAGAEPMSIATRDLNGDGFLDLVVLNRNSDTISVLNGGVGGNGASFATARPFTSGSSGSTPMGLALTDVNTDGKVDVVVANSRSNDASVLLGDGHGSFSWPRAFVSELEPQGITAADINGDSIPDVMTVNRGSSTPNIGILLGVGDGSLVAVEDVITDPAPTEVVTGDVNNDGLADLIVSELPPAQSTNGSVLVVRADTTTGFASPTVLRTAGDAVAVAAADFNADGWLDIAALNRSTFNVSVFLGKAAGGFGAKRDYPIATGAAAVTAGDWNRDGRPDLAITRQGSGSAGAVDILLANADGSFGTATSFPVGMSPVAIDSGDFNKDGKRDLAIANSVSNEVSVLLGKGDGTFQAATSFASTGGPRAIAVADFDRDGSDDLAVAVSINSHVTVFFGNGQGGFAAGPQLGVGGSASSIVARDVTGDLVPDILVTDQVNNVVSAFYSTGAGRQFRHDSRFDDVIVSRGPVSAGSADVDGDGRYDALAANGFLAGSVSVLTNIGATPAVLRGDSNADKRVTVADALAVIRQLSDLNGRRVEDVKVTGGTDVARAGIDANGDGLVTSQDVLAVTHELFPGL